ncbi:MAG: DUF1491 family protein [Alphaproteobacteria bacterium]
MMPARLKSAVYVHALMRRAETEGAHAFLVRRGAEEAGAVFLKVNRLDGTCMVLARAREGREGRLVWTRPLGERTDEAGAGEYFARQIRFDPDIWIVEIEDRQGRPFVDEPVI